jgi:hypothetical protein
MIQESAKDGCSEGKIALPGGCGGPRPCGWKRYSDPFAQNAGRLRPPLSIAYNSTKISNSSMDELENLRYLWPGLLVRLLVSNLAQCRAGKQDDFLTSCGMRKRHAPRAGGHPAQSQRKVHIRSLHSQPLLIP